MMRLKSSASFGNGVNDNGGNDASQARGDAALLAGRDAGSGNGM